MNRNKQNNNSRQHGGGPAVIGVGEKPKNFKKTIVSLIAYIKPQIRFIIIAIIAAIIGSILSLNGPDVISKITNIIVEGIATSIDIDAISKLGVLLVGLYLFGALLSFAQGYIMSTITQVITKKLRTDVATKINRLPIKYFNQNSVGDILSRVTNDVDSIGQTMNQSIGTLVSSITLLFGSLFMMITNNLILTATAVLSTFFGFGLMMVIMSRSQKYFVKQQADIGNINGIIEEIYTGQSIVRVYNATNEATASFDAVNNSLDDSGFKSQFLSNIMMPLMSFIGNFGYVSVSVVGALLAINGSIGFGTIVAFMLYIRYFTQPLSSLAQVATSFQSMAAAGERVFTFLDEEELEDETSKTEVLKDIRGDVEFKNVYFGYEDTGITVINDFSLKVKSGQKVAIVGPTGAGKTTLVNLLMRFHEINSGEMLIDNVSTKLLTRENVHDLFCMVLQDTWLYEGTIKDNIVYNEKNITDAEIIEASKAVGLHHFVETLPEGYNTILNETSSLSAGQKQQLTIARAMIKNAPMLILDEATSSVDTRTELIIQNAMDELMKGRTSFVIAHRLSTIKNADVIVAMKDGTIVETGDHETLLSSNGYYAQLYQSQFEEN